MGSNQTKQSSSDMGKTKRVITGYTPSNGINPLPPNLGKSINDIFMITGRNADFAELARPKGKRLFQDDKGTFMEQKKKQKGEKTIAE